MRVHLAVVAAVVAAAAVAAAAAAGIGTIGGARAAQLDEFGGLPELHADLVGILGELRSARDEERHAFGAIDGNETVVAGDGDGDDDETTLVVDGARETDAAAGVFATIQEAVDAAAPGTTIVVEPHPNAKGYNENVVIATAGVTLTSRGAPARMNFAQRRCPPARLDGCETRAALFGCDTTIISVRAPDVTVERLTLVHGSIVLGADAHRFTLRQSCVLDTTRNGILTATLDDDAAGGVLRGFGKFGTPEDVAVKDATIDANVFAFIGNNAYAAIALRGDFATITDNVVAMTFIGIRVIGSSTTVDNNYVLVTINDGIQTFDARGASVTHNLVVNAGADGIDYEGSAPHITDNVIIHSLGRGIEFDWDHLDQHGGTISHNSLRYIENDGIRVTLGDIDRFENVAPSTDMALLTGMEVTHNHVTLADDESTTFPKSGILMRTGDGAVVSHNVVTNCGIGIRLLRQARRMSITDNVVRGARLFGIAIASDRVDVFDNGVPEFGDRDGVLIARNTVRQCAVGVGIETGDEHVLENNTIVKNHGEGVAIAHGVHMAGVSGNRIEDNRTDVCSPDAYALEVAMSVAHKNQIGDVGECFVAAHLDVQVTAQVRTSLPATFARSAAPPAGPA